jgi:transcriptional regulator with PAS, ATPase and Fis domain
VRWVSATNRDLSEDVERGRFRRDLFYRLAGVTLEIPPLRERPKEIEPMARLFAGHLSAELGRKVPELSSEALALLHDYPWPGNLRELRNVIERALLVGGEGPIEPQHLRLGRPKRAEHPAPRSRRLSDETTEGDQRNRIVEVLERCAGNQTRAAEELGISRRTLSSRLDAHHIPRPRKH